MFLLFSFTANARTRTIEMTTGTGFYVSREGHVVTNEHVVQSCRSVHIKRGSELIKAKLLDVDAENDLALIQALEAPPKVASLRYEQNLKIGDAVTIIGYPVENGRADHARVRTARVIDTKGPNGQPGWLQFTDALAKGNSGGPLLDQFGNVIGVVRAKASYVEITYQQNPDGSKKEISRGPEKLSDIAINLPVLTAFLEKHFVAYNNMLNYEPLSATQLEEASRPFIVNVRCVQ